MLVQLTFDRAKTLKVGEILYHSIHKNADGTPERWKVNGKVKRWVRNPNRIHVPLKHGFRDYDYFNEGDFDTKGISFWFDIEEND